jgi:hypothetical protein
MKEMAALSILIYQNKYVKELPHYMQWYPPNSTVLILGLCMYNLWMKSDAEIRVLVNL